MNIPRHLVDRIHLVNLNGQCNVNILTIPVSSFRP